MVMIAQVNQITLGAIQHTGKWAGRKLGMADMTVKLYQRQAKLPNLQSKNMV